ncbi:uncharacterized protein [Lepeophtheirus salmonis]|uniref:uncharacterized protein n=1 Tax=Lepeophtheirus salmonis TaxID=72036 RepID=UPI001AE64887|nr:uncharacterized protein LOC121117099 [Lepeophtheirus salmonis]
MSATSSHCCYCSLSSKYRCSVCYAPYCSEQCQNFHWYKHVMMCKAPPALIPESKYKPLRKPRNSTKLPLPELPSQVYLESVQSVDEIVLLLDSKSVPVELEESTLESLSEDILPPMFAVFHPTLVKWVRATQTSAINSQGLIPVLYTDYGTRGFGTEAKTIPSHLLSIPPRAISASLYEVQPIADNERLLATIKKQVLDSGREFYVQSMGSSKESHVYVKLIDSNGNDLSEELVSSGLAQRFSYTKGLDLFEGHKASKSLLVLPKASVFKENIYSTNPQKERKSKSSNDINNSNDTVITENVSKSCVLTVNGNMPGSMPRSPTCKITTNGPLLSGLLNSESKNKGKETNKVNGIISPKGGSPLEAKKWTKRKSLIRQTSLDSVKPGIVLEFKVSSNEKNVISAFTLKSREGDAYINSAMQKESHEKLNNFVKGDEVKVKHSDFYFRAIALNNSEERGSTLSCVLVDYGLKVNVSHDHVYTPCSNGEEFKSYGVKLYCLDEEVAKISSGSIVAQVRHNVGGVILVDVEEKNASYLVIPFPYFDPETTMLFKYTSYEVPPSLSLKEKFKNHDEVNFLSFTEYANEVCLRLKADEDICCTLNSAFFILNLDEYTLHEEPRKDEIYACKWSDDDCYYRAQVKAINKKSSKVKVFFIDYGNSAIQDFNRLSYLPKLLSTVAPFCSKVKLEGVSAKSAKESTMEKLRSELESISLNIQIENNYSTVTLLSCGNPVNNLIEAIINKDE